MKKFVLLAALAAFCSFASAQYEASNDPVTKAYHKYRMVSIPPSYGLAKVKRMVARLKPDKEDNQRLSAAQYNSLSTAEKFTYCLIHGEDMMQNCDAMPVLVGEEKHIYAHEPDAFTDEESGWSDRQKKFLHDHRGEVIGMLRSMMKTHHRVGLNMKNVIEELGAWELIPDMAAVFNTNHKDLDILTVMMGLMKDGKYQPFMESQSYTKLFGDNSNYVSYIDGNTANQKLVLERAMGYYRSRKG